MPAGEYTERIESSPVYSAANQEIAMTVAKPEVNPVVEPIIRYTPAELAVSKKNRTERRKAIKSQNARSKMK